MKSPVILNLMGGFDLTTADGKFLAVEPARLRQLVAFLALHPEKAHQRVAVAARLWPRSKEGQARTNLRKLLVALRKAEPTVQALIMETGGQLAWVKDAATTDVSLLFSLMKNHAASVAELEKAAVSAGEELFPECYEEWIDPIRTRCRDGGRELLQRLVRHHKNAGNHSEVIKYARALLRNDPLDETSALVLMETHAQTGAFARSVAVYENTVRSLEKELGVGPGKELTASYARLISEHDPEAVRDVTAPPLVGRKDAVTQVKRVLDRIKQTGSRLILLRGEPGIGKTRLIQEIVGDAHRLGISAHSASCFESAASSPFSPLVEMLRSMGRRRLAILDEPWRGELSVLVPELLPGAVPPVSGRREPWQLERFFEAVSKALLPDRVPTMMVLDDAHWADTETVSWAAYVLRTRRSSPHIFLGALRTGWETAPRWNELITELERDNRVQFFDLDRFTLNDTALLAGSVFGRKLADEEAAAVHRDSEGNPLFIVELARAAQETGRKKFVPSDTNPTRIHSVVTSRLALLTPAAKKLACEAAVFRSDFTRVALALLLGTEENLTPVLEELCRKEVLLPAESIVEEAYRFSHQLIREIILQTLSLPERSDLHRRAASVVRQTRRGAHQAFAEASHHLELVPDIPGAIDALRLAADAAMEIDAPAEAVRLLRHAGGLAGVLEESSPATGAKKLAGIHEALGLALIQTGRRTEGRAELEDALMRYGRAEPLRRAVIHLTLAETWTWEFDSKNSTLALDRAEELLGDHTDAAHRSTWLDVQLARAEMLYYTNQNDALSKQLTRLEQPVADWGQPGHRISYLRCVAMADFRRRQYWQCHQALDAARESMDLISPDAHPDQQLLARFGYGFALLWSDQIDQALIHLDEAAQAAESTANSPAELRAVTYIGVAARLSGDVARAKTASQHAAQLALLAKDVVYGATAVANLAWCAWREGDSDTARKLARQAANDWRDKPYPFQGLALWLLIALESALEEESAVKLAERMLEADQFIRPELETILEAVKKKGVLSPQNRKSLVALNFL